MDIRLAHCGPPKALKKGLSPTSNADLPALLVSFYYLNPFVRQRDKYAFRDWSMDSGAFSAHNSGKAIDPKEYTETCRHLLATDPMLTEVFALDVIGDHRASLRNCEKMWEDGIEAIPCFHRGEPWDALLHIAKNYPKIALGGVVGLHAKKKMEWVGQCFARVWPKRIHGFGMGARDMVLGFPFESVDATNWELGPCAFGRWNKFGNMSVRGGEQNLRVEVDYYLELERLARARWRKEMAQLKAIGPVVRLAHANGAGGQGSPSHPPPPCPLGNPSKEQTHSSP